MYIKKKDLTIFLEKKLGIEDIDIIEDIQDNVPEVMKAYGVEHYWILKQSITTYLSIFNADYCRAYLKSRLCQYEQSLGTRSCERIFWFAAGLCIPVVLLYRLYIAAAVMGVILAATAVVGLSIGKRRGFMVALLKDVEETLRV